MWKEYASLMSYRLSKCHLLWECAGYCIPCLLDSRCFAPMNTFDKETTLVKQSCRLYIRWYPRWWIIVSFLSASTMHHLLFLALLLACFTLGRLQNATDNMTTSSRMSEVMHMANTYPSARVHHFKPLTMPEPMPMGAQMMGSWPQRSHNVHPQYYPHYSSHLPGSPIVPLAVSFSVGYLLFRLLALGVIFLEKGFA